MPYRLYLLLVVPLTTLLPSGDALAHHPMGGAVPKSLMEGLLSGLGHPLLGVDHLAFIVGVAILAGLQGTGLGVPLAFVAGSLLGVVAAARGFAIGGAEAWVAGSVVLVGVAMMLRLAPGRAVWIGFTAVAGLLHGTVYGETVIGAEPTPIAAYLVGLAVLQSTLAAGAHYMGVLWRNNPFLEARAQTAGLILALLGATYGVMVLTAS